MVYSATIEENTNKQAILFLKKNMQNKIILLWSWYESWKTW